MHSPFRWLGIAALLLVAATSSADPLKPYVVMMLDTSGSMDNVTNAGPPSCGGRDNRLNHARCAINRIVNSYGDMVFALGRFRETGSGTVGNGQSCDANGDIDGNGNDQCNTSGVGCSSCNCNGRTQNCSGCSTTLYSDARGEMLTGLVDGGNQAASTWTDFQCGSCGGQGTSLGSQPEIWGTGSWTPLGGFLASASRYWQGLQATDSSVIWPSASAGFDPIRNDPTKTAFLPIGCNPNPATCGGNCCVQQCRPYITIMLTDGAETCGGNAVPVAQSMLNTVIDNRGYRIETKVIGFGLTPGNADIEAYAHAGGAPDLPGVFEGFYANDEASLQLALSQILADAVKVETCNNLDDDCDGVSDEDFLPPNMVPGKGSMCNNGQLGICARTGQLLCRADGAGLECNAQTVTPGVEMLPCNGLDDDCDGRIDENLGCTQCIPTGEICDGNDNDCDGVPDQVCRCSNNINERCDGIGNDCGGAACDCAPLTQQCGIGACVGIATCTAPNMYTGCTAATPNPNGESCNGADDDCDGLCDGFTLECSDVITPNGPGTDSPGHPNNTPIPQNICRPGLKTCALGCTMGPKNFGACSGEVRPCNGQVPCVDPCNGIDDDCDNSIDEDFASADCSTNCGLGATACQNGTIVCNSVMQGVDDTCNGQDEDCDNKFDEHWGEMVGGVTCLNDDGDDTTCDPCTMNGAGDPVCDGITQCVAGVPTCSGGPVNPEVCNCLDDDCDGAIDEDPDPNDPNNNICPGQAACVNCQCAVMCTNDEFPCPLGKRCEVTASGNFCVNDPCFNVTCPMPTSGNAQVCRPKPGFPNEPECVDTCATKNCTGGLICHGPTGECLPNDCSTFPERCAANENCIAGTCIVNPCEGVTCDSSTYCVSGACVASCGDVTCAAGQRCRLGACEADPCDKPCPFGQACNDSTGKCIEDPCKFRDCPVGQWCNPNEGQCAEDPCVSSEIVCPNAGDVCRGGSCFDPNQLGPDAAPGSFVTVGGGGCSTGNGGGWLLALGALGVLLSRRRRAIGRAL